MTKDFPDPATDTDAFLRWLREGAAQGRELAAARPSLRDVAQHLLAFEEEMVDALWDGRDTEKFRMHPLEPHRSAPGDIAGTPHLNPNGALTNEVADGYVTATRDHLGGIGSLAAVDGSRRSLLVLARTLLDVSTRAAYLLEPDIDDMERTRRAFNFLMDAIREEIADGDDSTGLLERQAELRAAAEADGFEFATKRNKAGNPVPDRNVLAPRVDPRKVRGEFLGDVEFAWRALSSVTHGQEREVLRFALGLGPVSPGVHGDSYSLVWLATSVESAAVAAAHAADYYGAQLDELLIQRVREVLWAAAGMRDDAVRRRLGFDS
ncbi:hypothetical protein [Isoptericola sp. NPDC056605]|uniref:hypothetical protein n=1 Tax=Isoptericola sp. NPDC056605 TaxID=3345876 RepID=UPI0036A771A1